MLSTTDPLYVPILLPNDEATLDEMPPREALMISATYWSNPRLKGLVARAGAAARTLLVDPKTPYFQFEGYMSMPDYRALPYSPGRGTLGTLWEPGRFTRESARHELINTVFDVQRELGADIFLAPYFYIPHPEHPWRATTGAFATEAVDARTDRPVGIPVCVDIDALIDRDHREAIASTYIGIDAALLWVTIVNYDERRADPRDAHAVMSFLEKLQEGERPVILSHVGRTGLVAIARGAAGYASGTHGLESHPRSFFREMMGSRPANSYYLHECFIHVAVRAAEASLRLEAESPHEACACRGCNGESAITRMVSRRLALHAVSRRFLEIDELTSIEPGARSRFLVDRFTAALGRAPELAAALAASGPQRIGDGEFHYLEVLREAAGGAAATIPMDEASA